ncbi:MAG TPA: SBBP repeat-containing protein [Ignavibacteriaceae bacterium]|nr:SBBP repeat-containing protein [Ignavibacteriaceae bacterium]
MKKFTVVLLVTFLSAFLYAQAPLVSRSAKGGGTGKDVAHAIAVDNNTGNVYVASEFTGKAFFGNDSLISAGNVDYALVKYDSIGSALWRIRAGGTLTDRGYGVGVDAAGNVYSCGEYFGTAIFGTDTLVMLGNNLEGFVAKYNSNGSKIWLKDIKGGNQDATRGMVVDNSGNVIVAGYFGGTTVPTGVIFDTDTLSTFGLRDIFLVKYNTNGQVVWAKHFGGALSTEEGRSVTVDAIGNIYLTGTFNTTATFDAITLNAVGGVDMFVAKISPIGSVIWAKSAGGLKEDEGNGIAIDLAGNVYVGGRFDSAMVIGGNPVLSKGDYDAFFAKYNSNGDFQWVKTAGGTLKDYIYELTVDRNNKIGVLGTFQGTAYFLGDTLVTAGGDDIFLALFDSTGNPEWLKHFTGSDVDKGFAMDVDYGTNLYITGSFKGATFNLDGTTYATSGAEDIFYARVGFNVVPVELTSFSASVNGKNVTLTWNTATELNNAGFEIERSTDKVNFSKIGFVSGKGTITENSLYTYTDINPGTSTFYYRLKQKDFDGSWTYSNIVEVNVSLPTSFSVSQNYPNPFNPSTQFNFSIPVDARVNIAIYNTIGQKLYETSSDYKAGTYTQNINGNNFSSGIYFYTIKAAGKDGSVFSSTKKMVLTK